MKECVVWEIDNTVTMLSSKIFVIVFSVFGWKKKVSVLRHYTNKYDILILWRHLQTQ